MYKLLIVDDEYWVRRRLAETIDWKSIGIDEVYGAEDGKKALGICIRVEPDIVVTDVNMPGLSGIDLMQALHICALRSRFIFISGFAEYEYALSAMNLGSVDYLLKPIDEKELMIAIQKIIADMEKHENKKAPLDMSARYTSIHMRSVAGSINSGNRPESEQGLQQLLEEFLSRSNQNPAPLDIKLFYISVMNVLLKNCLVPEAEEFINIFIDSLDDIGTFFTPKKLMHGLKRMADYLFAHHGQTGEKKTSFVSGENGGA